MTRRSHRSAPVAIAATCVVLFGCTVGPNYSRPAVDVPVAFRDEHGIAARKHYLYCERIVVAGIHDPALQSLVRTALEQNADIRVAAARILQAQAQLGITRADQFPAVSAGVDVLGERPAVALGFPSANVFAFQVQGSVSWELDFWGRFRRATEAARAQLLASEWGRRAVVTTLVGQVADAYFGLRALDLELDIARRTLTSREGSLRLTQVREQGGATSLVDVRQAEQLVYGARSEIATLERQIAQQENFIRCCSGRTPDRSVADCRSPSSRTRLTFPPVCPRCCWRNGPISSNPNFSSWRPTRRSASLGRPISQHSTHRIRRFRKHGVDVTLRRSERDLERGDWRDAAAVHGRPHTIAGRAGQRAI